MRLIDADALPRHGKRGGLVHWKDIENAPTVDNTSLVTYLINHMTYVVRCKDCRFFEDEDEYGNCYCSEWGNITKANGYCHDAERREDGKAG